MSTGKTKAGQPTIRQLKRLAQLKSFGNAAKNIRKRFDPDWGIENEKNKTRKLRSYEFKNLEDY